MRVRRSAQCFLRLEGGRAVALSVATGEELPLDPDGLARLLEIPEDRWVDGGDGEALEPLLRAGLLVGEGQVAESRWNPYAALFHLGTSWRGVGVELDERAAGESEPMPPAFHSAPGSASPVPLPLLDPGGALYEVLAARKTTRVFSAGAALDADALSILLRWVWGCHGTARVAGGGTILRKTSPSGGALHSLEVYPLLLAVEGHGPGLYHYRVADHALEPLVSLDEGKARELAI